MKMDIQTFIERATYLLNVGEYGEVKKLSLSALESLDKQHDTYAYFLDAIAGYLIDSGNEGIDCESIKKGIEILEQEESVLKEYQTDQSYLYNLANGKSALYRINNLYDKYPTLDTVSSDLIEAKNYYYKAYKLIDVNNLTELDLQIITNLSIVLNQSGRVIEAIGLYDRVLKKDNKFIEALISYSEALDYWMRTSGCSQPIALYCIIYSSMDKADKSGKVSKHFKGILKDRMEYYRELISSCDYDLNSMEEDFRLSEEEYSTHSSFRRFSIDNYLTLNEHAVFCGCFSATLDDLRIGNKSLVVIGEKALKMELFLNRLKSEFHIARKLYLESVYLENVMCEVVYSDLDVNEQVGEAVEKLRVSFRLCFGILDKIAHAVCYFLNIKNNPKESIYFESFWKNPQRKDRWNILKDYKNPHLVALYSIANDLNSNNGEFGFYKKWRNLLEHNNLILKEDDFIDNASTLLDDEDFTTVVSYNYFKEQAIHLLQLCRASIFSFTYFIRTEGLSSGGDKEIKASEGE